VFPSLGCGMMRLHPDRGDKFLLGSSGEVNIIVEMINRYKQFRLSSNDPQAGVSHSPNQLLTSQVPGDAPGRRGRCPADGRYAPGQKGSGGEPFRSAYPVVVEGFVGPGGRGGTPQIVALART